MTTGFAMAGSDVVVGTVLAVAVLTLIPARAGARRPVAEVLRAE